MPSQSKRRLYIDASSNTYSISALSHSKASHLGMALSPDGVTFELVVRTRLVYQTHIHRMVHGGVPNLPTNSHQEASSSVVAVWNRCSTGMMGFHNCAVLRLRLRKSELSDGNVCDNEKMKGTVASEGQI